MNDSESGMVTIEGFELTQAAADALHESGIEQCETGDTHTRRPLSIVSRVNPSVSYWFGNGLEYAEVLSACQAYERCEYNEYAPKALIYDRGGVGSERDYGVVTEHAAVAARLVCGGRIDEECSTVIADKTMVSSLKALDDEIEEQWGYWEREGTTGEEEYIAHYDECYDRVFYASAHEDAYFQSKAGLHGLDVAEQLESLMYVLGYDYTHNKGCRAVDFPPMLKMERDYAGRMNVKESRLDAVLSVGEVCDGDFTDDPHTSENVVPCEVTYRGSAADVPFLPGGGFVTTAAVLARALVKGMATGIMEVACPPEVFGTDLSVVRKIKLDSEAVRRLRDRLEFNVAAVATSPFDMAFKRTPKQEREGDSPKIYACALLRGARREMDGTFNEKFLLETVPSERVVRPMLDGFWEDGLRKAVERKLITKEQSQGRDASGGVEL